MNDELWHTDERIEFGVNRSKVKVTVEYHMLETGLYGQKHTVLNVSSRGKISSFRS